MSDMNDKILDILQWYGESFDSQGWEVKERFVAKDKIKALIKETLNDCLPEKIKVSNSDDSLDWWSARGFNQAIDQMQSNLNKKLEVK